MTQEVYALDLCSWYPLLFSVTSEGEVNVAVIAMINDNCNVSKSVKDSLFYLRVVFRL